MFMAGPASSTAMRCESGPAREGAMQLRRIDLPFALIEQLDVAAQGDGRQTVLRAVAIARRLHFSSGLPKPMLKRSTLKPSFFATQ